MPLIVPPSLPFNDPLAYVPLDTYKEPNEGRKSVPIDLLWSNAINKSVTAFAINLQNNATLEISKISGLVVDNSLCGSDIDFIFPDSSTTITIPAYAPYTVLAIHSNQRQFTVKARAPINGDETFMQVLNFAPPPVAVPITVQQKTAASGSINITGAGNTQIVAAGINGTLQGLNVSFANPKPAGAFNAAFTLQDGAGVILWKGNLALDATSPGLSGELVSINGLNARFINGLVLTQGGVGSNGTLDINVYYIIP
jgi:hypothetical protein